MTDPASAAYIQILTKSSPIYMNIVQQFNPSVEETGSCLNTRKLVGYHIPFSGSKMLSD